jgi:hypothetical protein
VTLACRFITRARSVLSTNSGTSSEKVNFRCPEVHWGSVVRSRLDSKRSFVLCTWPASSRSSYDLSIAREIVEEI